MCEMLVAEPGIPFPAAPALLFAAPFKIASQVLMLGVQ